MAASVVRTVALRLSSALRGGADRDVEFLRQLSIVLVDKRLRLGVGRNGGRVDDAEVRIPGDAALSVLLLDVDLHIDRGDELGLFLRFDHDGASVKEQREVVIVAGQDDVDGTAVIERAVHLAVGVNHGNHQVGTSLAKGLRFGDGRLDRWKKREIGTGTGLHGTVFGREPDEAHLHATHVDDAAILEALERLSVGLAEIGGIERELRLASCAGRRPRDRSRIRGCRA